MVFVIKESAAASEALDRLAGDPGMTDTLAAIEAIIDHLEADPFDPQLRTIAFKTVTYGNVNATPVRRDDWYVFWRRGSEPGALVLLQVQQLAVERPGRGAW